MDEVIWVGDKEGEGVFKGLIIELILMIEGKGKDVFVIVNLVWIVFVLNEKWVVLVG